MSDPPTSTPRYIHELPGGSFRYSTETEIANALEVAARCAELVAIQKDVGAKLLVLRQECKHLACMDREGFPYNIRTCVACGYATLL